MKKILLFTALIVLLASCSNKPKFGITGSIEGDELDSCVFKVEQTLRGEVIFSDVTKIKNNKFKLSVPYTKPAVMSGIVSDVNNKTLNRFIFVTEEEGKIDININGNKVSVTGTPLNDRLQDYLQVSDSMGQLLDALNDKYRHYFDEKTATQEIRDEYQTERTRLVEENTDILMNFMKENIDNPLGEYYFMVYYIMMRPEDKERMTAFASDEIKEKMGLQ